jgi:hypothetical protein
MGSKGSRRIFTVFQTELAAEPNPEWADIYFDLDASHNAQDSAFVPISAEEQIDKNRYFPMNVLFDSVKYRENTAHLSQEQIARIDKLQEKFKEVQIPVQILKSEDRSIVAIVFERINHLGVALDTLQLLSAWTWSDDFDLLDKFKELREELSEFGFAGVGDDAVLVLSCVAGILTKEPGPEKLLDLNGADVRSQFSTVQNGIRGAIDFLRTQLKVVHLKLLPYPAMLIPLAAFFAEPERRPGADVIVHSDRGSQYCSGLFQDTLKAYGMRSSMSRRGDCWDTQFKMHFERRTDLTRAGIGRAALALTCRSGSGVPRALPGPTYVT